MSVKRLKGFATPDICTSILESVKFGANGLGEGSSYGRGIVSIQQVIEIAQSKTVIDLAREILGLPTEPLGYLSLTAFTVEPGSSGMVGHIDYPHFYPDFYSAFHAEFCTEYHYQRPLSAQFIMSLDGTTGGAAPTWLGDETQVQELNTGDLVAFAGDIKHGVLPNTSGRSRTNMLWSIGPAWVRPTQMSLWDMRIDDKPYSELIHIYNETHAYNEKVK